jgi:hypothetical protein
VFDHLKCYTIRDFAPRANYNADLIPQQTPPFNEEDGCKIVVPAKWFCTDVDKTNVTPTPPEQITGATAQDYLCYELQCPRIPTLPLVVEDQFGLRNIYIEQANHLCAPAVASCESQTINIATGQSGGAGSPDPIWNLETVPPALPPTPPPARKATIISSNFGWTTEPGTQWVSYDTNCDQETVNNDCLEGYYTYQICWQQCGPVTLNMQVLADNTATVSLTGNGVIGNGVNFISATTINQVVAGSSVKNCLTVRVDNFGVGGYPPSVGTATGIDVSGTIVGPAQLLP